MVRAKWWVRWLSVLGGLAACGARIARAADQTPAVAVAATSASGTEAKERTVARAAFKQGVAAYDAGRFQEALLEFKTASALGAPQVHFNLAETHRALEQFPEAIGEYETFLAACQDGAPYVAEARGAIAELDGKVGHLEVSSDRGAELLGAELVIDGQAHPLPETGHLLRLMPGRHQITVSQQGKIPFVRSMVLAAGGRTTLLVTLATSEVADKGRVSEPTPGIDWKPAPPPHKPFYRSPWFLGGVGAVLVGAVAASVWAAWPRHCQTGGEVLHCTNL